MRDNSVVFRNTIRIRWEVEDKESFIQRQYLSIASHKGGEFNATSTEVGFRENGQIVCFDTNKKQQIKNRKAIQKGKGQQTIGKETKTNNNQQTWEKKDERSPSNTGG